MLENSGTRWSFVQRLGGLLSRTFISSASTSPTPCISGDHAGQVPGAADLDVVREVFTTDVFGVIAVTEAMLPLMRRSPSARILLRDGGMLGCPQAIRLLT